MVLTSPASKSHGMVVKNSNQGSHLRLTKTQSVKIGPGESAL